MNILTVNRPCKQWTSFTEWLIVAFVYLITTLSMCKDCGFTHVRLEHVATLRKFTTGIKP